MAGVSTCRGPGPGHNPGLQTLAHAALGCGAASLAGNDCAAGAVGGATESVLGNVLDVELGANGQYDKRTQFLYTAGAILSASLVAEGLGLDASTAIGAAQNAAVNNRMLHPHEKEWIRQKAREQALADCAGIASCDVDARTLYWVDAMSAVGHARTDAGAAEAFDQYAATLAHAATDPALEGYHGQATGHLADLAYAEALLQTQAGRPIVDAHGQPYYGRDGEVQTYFSATEQQWRDPYLNVFPGGTPVAQVVPGQAQREQARIDAFLTRNGSAEPVIVEDILVPGAYAVGGLFKAGSTRVGAWLTSATERGAVKVEGDMLGTGIGFASEAKLIGHFEKHGIEFGATTTDEYIRVGHEIMLNGQKIEYLYKGEVRTGYVQFIGNSSRGDAKFGFVGTDVNGAITTIHTQSGNSFWKLLNGHSADKTIKPKP